MPLEPKDLYGRLDVLNGHKIFHKPIGKHHINEHTLLQDPEASD